MKLDTRNLKPGGFTLIELLIVVAIIAILAAIGIVNYLHAQTRARVSRAKAEMQTIATALESYYTDFNAYPRWREVAKMTAPAGLNSPPVSWRLRPLTTPISYIATIPGPDPFLPITDINDISNYKVYDTYDYIDAESSAEDETLSNQNNIGQSIYGRAWRLSSAGPDRIQSYGRSDYSGNPPNIVYTSFGFYDPTNGLTSNGDIVRLGAKSPFYTDWYLGFEPQ